MYTTRLTWPSRSTSRDSTLGPAGFGLLKMMTMTKTYLIHFLGLFAITCQTRQLLRSNRKNSVVSSRNLNVSNGHPLVPRCRVILEHLPGKRSLLVVRDAKITSAL